MPNHPATNTHDYHVVSKTSFRIPTKLREEFAQAARARGMTKTQALIEAIAQWLKAGY